MKDSDVPIRPFLKWAGSKYRIVDRVRRKLPDGQRLVEPFAGSGAVFLNTDYPRYLLADSNADLITLYQTLQREGAKFIDDCRALFTPENNTAETFYQFRDEFNNHADGRDRAMLFVYLNRHGYNGLCRYNARGGFNVPFGRYVRPYFPEKEMLAFHHKARRAEFLHADFETVMAESTRGDVVYCDPPYVPLSVTANFTSYSSGGFDLDQQQRLADLAEQLAQSGVPVLISNHNTPFTRTTYKNAGASLSRFQVQRYISCQGESRGQAAELLALFSTRAVGQS